jgi:hypothetical protein
LYQKLVETTQQMVKQTKRVVSARQTQAQQPAQRLVAQVEQVLPLIERVIAQTRKRVLENKKAPSSEKVLSFLSCTPVPFLGTKGEPWWSSGSS